MTANKNDVFHSGLSGILRSSFGDLDRDIKSGLLAKLEERGMLDELLDGCEYINLREKVRICSAEKETTFHEWLLTNPDERAFKIWLKVRDRVLLDPMYKRTRIFNDTAALIMYSNLPERLKHLNNKIYWKGFITPSSLYEEGVSFKHKGGVANDTKRRILEYIKTENSFISAMDVAALQGSAELLKLTRKYDTKIHLNKYFYKYYIKNESNANIKFLLSFMKEVFNSKDAPTIYYKNIQYLFENATLCSNIDQLKIIWEEMNEDVRADFFIYDFIDEHRHGGPLDEKIMEKDRADVIEYLSSLEDTMVHNGMERQMRKFSFENLKDCVMNGRLKMSELIIKRNPDFLKRLDWVYENRRERKKGNILALAIANSEFEMAELLLSLGASMEPLNKLMKYEPFINYMVKSDEGFIPRAEQFILKQKVKNNNAALGSNNRKAMDLMAL